MVGTPVTSTAWAAGVSNAVSAATGDIVVDVVHTGGTTEPTIGANQTQIYTNATNPWVKGSREAGAATTTMSWTGDTQNWASGAVAIKKAE